MPKAEKVPWGSYQDDDGMWIIHAKLPPESGALVIKAIDAILQEEQAEQEDELKQQQNEQQEPQNKVKNVSADMLIRSYRPDL